MPLTGTARADRRKASTSDIDRTRALEAHQPTPLVVVGASGSDGLRQLVAFVAALPANLPAAVLVVLHRPAGRRSHLPAILARSSHLRVVIPVQCEPLRTGVCYVADLDHHLSVGSSSTVELTPDHQYRNRTVDLLFAAAARHARDRVIGVVLEGALSDGAAGLAAIRRAGGGAMVLDAYPDRRGGMPQAARGAVPDAQVANSPSELAAAVVASLAPADSLPA
jgi:two-component system, chemotaxis family, protein-glutamate methylesterase/glutaminase